MTLISVDIGDWKKEYKNLKQKALNLDKDVFKLFYFTKTTNLKNEIQSLLEAEEKLETERQAEKENLFRFISILKKDLKNLKEALKTYSKSPDYLSKIQTMTENIEEKISRFKESQMVNFDKLIEEETQLYHEIMLINDKIDTYEAPSEYGTASKSSLGGTSSIRSIRSTSARPYKLGNRDTKRTDLHELTEEDLEPHFDEDESAGISKPEVGIEKKMRKLKEEIDHIESEIIRIGGKNGGWDDEDHQTFLKIKTKHKGQIDKLNFLNDCITCLPFLGEEKIKEHIERHKLYNTLEEKKKELLAQYKECKDTQKQFIIEAIHKEEELKKEDEKKAKIIAIKMKEERDRVKEQIKEWKTKKLATQMVEKENRNLQQLEKKKEEEALLKMKKEEAQKKLEEYRAQKLAEKIRQKEREEYQKSLAKRQLTKEDLARIKEKEDEILKKKQDLIAMKKQKQMEKTEKIQKILETQSIAYSWVEPRLNEDTKAAQDKKREKFDPSKDRGRTADTFGGQVTRNAGRAIPLWRQGL